MPLTPLLNTVPLAPRGALCVTRHINVVIGYECHGDSRRKRSCFQRRQGVSCLRNSTGQTVAKFAPVLNGSATLTPYSVYSVLLQFWTQTPWLSAGETEKALSRHRRTESQGVHARHGRLNLDARPLSVRLAAEIARLRRSYPCEQVLPPIPLPKAEQWVHQQRRAVAADPLVASFYNPAVRQAVD